MSDEKHTPLPAAEYLIYKKYRGYYRPNNAGYTYNSCEAGRYTLAEAETERANEPAAITYRKADHGDDPAYDAAALRALVSELVGALAGAEKCIDGLRKGLGAPGDYGYDTKEGKALFACYQQGADISAALASARAAGFGKEQA